MGTERDEVLQALSEILDALSSAPGIGAFEDLSPIHLHILSMYGRCLSLYKGMTILITENLPEEGLFLARSLFEDSLRLGELAEATDERRRARLVTAWAISSLARDKKLIEKAKKGGLDGPHDEYLKKLKDKEVYYQKLAGRLKAKGPKFRSRWDAAAHLGRSSSEWMYGAANVMVHGNLTSQTPRSHKGPDGQVAISTSTSDPRMLAVVGAFGAESMVIAYLAALEIFDWPPLANSENLLTKVEELVSLSSDPTGSDAA